MKEDACISCGSGAFDSKWKWTCYYCNRVILRDSSDHEPYQFHRNCITKWKRTLPKDKCRTCLRYYYTNNIYIRTPELLKDVVLEEWDLMDLLKYAVVEDNLSLIETLYRVGENIYVEGDFALRMSAELGRLNLVKFLLEHGANVHAENDAALLLSIRNGHFEVVKYLIEQAGADPHVNDKSALMYSAENGHVEIVKYLVEHGENIHTSENSALNYGIMRGHLAVVKYLFENGANIDDIWDYSIMLTEGSDEFIQYLSEKGVKMDF